MRNLGKQISVVVGLALLLALGAAPLFLAYQLIAWLGDLEGGDRNAVLAAGAALSVPVVTYFTNQRLDRRRSLEGHTREQKIQLYEDLITFFMRMLLEQGTKSALSEEEMLAKFREMTPKLITYASNGVIKKWGRMRIDLATLAAAGDHRAVLKGLEDLYKEIRKDVGHSSLSLQEGDISRLFINDIDEISKRG